MITYKKACLSALASAAMLLCAAQAHAQTYYFQQKFSELGAAAVSTGFDGLLSGTFTAIDANADLIFQSSEMTFLTLTYVGIAPTLGAVNLSFTPPNISISAVTEWYVNDKTLGDGFNGFFLGGASATGTQMTWAAGPANFFDYGNTPGLNSGGDAQNSTFRFGEINLFDSFGTPIATAKSDEYVQTAVPEPSTYLMLLGGIAAVALKVRRRAA